MKKIFNKLALGAGTIGLIVAGAAAFSAFEAHVVNVTATIENALTVPQELGGIGFGTVFPEEVLHKNLDITLSASFLTEPRVDDVEYMIRQKPKCGVVVPGSASGTPVTYSSFPQVTEDGDTFICPVGSVQLPLLCPYLSKHEITKDGTDQEGENDSTGINAFHGPITNWKLSDTIATQVLGRLVKAEGDTSDTWDIDLHAPCFKGQCAQDNVVPASYQPDASLNHTQFGCDLWVEVTDISPSGEQPTTSPLTVVKQVINDNGGTATSGMFSLFVDGVQVTSGVSTTTTVGTHTVTEGAHAGYTQSFGGNCGSTGLVTVASSSSATCIVINDDIAPPTTTPMGSLTVTKIVLGTTTPVSSFNIMVDGQTVTSGVATTTTAGAHVVSETPNSNFNTVVGGANCDSSGNVTVSTSTPAFCTITNTAKTGGLTVIKQVVGTSTPISSFSFFVDGNAVTSGAATTTLVPGVHVVSEGPHAGFTSVISGDCDSAGNVTVPGDGQLTCTITNTLITGTLTVTKVVDNSDGVGTLGVGNFPLFVDGNSVTSGSSTTQTVGAHVVSETSNPNYTTTFSAECPGGNVNVPPNGNASCTITNIAKFGTITVTKVVVNDDGGNNSVPDFTLFVDATVMTSSISKKFAPGTYGINESGVSGYIADFTGDCSSVTQLLTIAAGDNKTCTITNNDIKPNITLKKVVVNDSGGTAIATDFIMRIDGGVPVPTGSTKQVTSNAAHTITEDVKSGYHLISVTGDAKCPATLGGSVTLDEGEAITCTITNGDN